MRRRRAEELTANRSKRIHSNADMKVSAQTLYESNKKSHSIFSLNGLTGMGLHPPSDTPQKNKAGYTAQDAPSMRTYHLRK